MKLRYKILTGLLSMGVISVAVFAVVLSHNKDCVPTPAAAAGAELMNAVTYQCYGSPEVLEISLIEKPTLADGEALVKVHSAAVNPLDWHYMRGEPYIMRLMGGGLGKPADTRLGVDFAGTIESTGKNFTRFKAGERVFGGRTGAFGEYVIITEKSAVAAIPDSISFEQAAAVPIAAITALQALRDIGGLKAGEKVLINGASGGVGTYAVQIAKHMGAEVTGVCSARNADMVRSIGADHVIDYKTESYIDSGKQFDLIIDSVGNHSLWDNRSVMPESGRLVMVGGSPGNWLGPLMRPIGGMLMGPFVSQKFELIMAKLKTKDLELLADLMESGAIASVIDRHYSLQEVPAAIAYSEEGHARGKIIVDLLKAAQ
jgi:NADPH:quinone reductase-like Zn-dependent oxidoreductase